MMIKNNADWKTVAGTHPFFKCIHDSLTHVTATVAEYSDLCVKFANLYRSKSVMYYGE